MHLKKCKEWLVLYMCYKISRQYICIWIQLDFIWPFIANHYSLLTRLSLEFCLGNSRLSPYLNNMIKRLPHGFAVKLETRSYFAKARFKLPKNIKIHWGYFFVSIKHYRQFLLPCTGTQIINRFKIILKIEESNECNQE